MNNKQSGDGNRGQSKPLAQGPTVDIGAGNTTNGPNTPKPHIKPVNVTPSKPPPSKDQ